ncbi:hypothetical protein GCM10010399_43840 [Dactylosporangium fulvum]|uniref:Uncharacterized protein n=1 Tax=Dactylosporangium fulvum TaxID=53359 RepID=A0ABY5WAA0_9ACTN|nr:hypothetical protein [Dactylosporangium fulvum]UWP85949.1 hypothetical protein Dfulv_17520 [Dactylosporangium fulvum]
MSPLTRASIKSAAEFVRRNWADNPAASQAFAHRLRAAADAEKTAATTDDERRTATALTLAADAAVNALAELEAAA